MSAVPFGRLTILLFVGERRVEPNLCTSQPGNADLQFAWPQIRAGGVKSCLGYACRRALMRCDAIQQKRPLFMFAIGKATGRGSKASSGVIFRGQGGGAEQVEMPRPGV